MKISRKILALWMLGAMASVGSAASLSFTNNGGTQARVVDFDGNVASTPIANLTAQGLFSLLGVSVDNKTWDFQVVVKETGSVDARVAGLGFIAITPSFASGSVTSDGGTQWKFTNSGNFPNGFPSIVACLIDNTNTCAGGGNGGVANGGSATVKFQLVFSAATTTVSFDGLGVRYQSIVGVTQGTSGTGTGGDPRIPPDETTVPEPSTYALIGASLVALQVLRKRK